MRSTFVFRLAFLLSLSGCSLLLTRGPRGGDQPVVQGHQQSLAAPDCTTSMAWPTVDGILAGLFTISVFATISDNNNNTNTGSNENRDSDVAAAIILAGAAGISAFIGHTRVTRCRRATETYTASYYGQQQPQYAYPQQYPQQPQYQYPQQYPPQGYPAPQQYPTQPQPAPVVQPVAPVAPAPPVAQPPGRQPAPAPAPVAKPAPKAPAPKVPAPKPPAPKAPDPLGTEGDVCAAQADCSPGLTCTGNVCLKAK